MTEKDIQILEKIKEKVVKRHKECKREGYSYKDDILQPCICMKIFKYIIELHSSQIPMDYWNLSLDVLETPDKFKKDIRLFIKHIDNAIEQGQGMLITGAIRGIGKTSLACEIAKEAIIKRYSVYYNIMQLIVSDTFSDEKEIINSIKNADLVIIDELDKVAMKENSNLAKQIENFLRELLPNRKSIILCSNVSIDEIESKMKLESLLKRYMHIVNINEGEDYSEKKNKTLKEKLQFNIDYFSKTIIESAERFYNNEEVAKEREYNKLFEE